jgi:predicted nucleotidyltransferase
LYADERKEAINSLLNELIMNLRKELEGLEIKYGVGALWIFGSYVQGEQHKRSDLDVLVEFSEVPNLPEFIALESCLSCLSDITGIKADLVSIGSPKGDTCKRILSERVPV